MLDARSNPRITSNADVRETIESIIALAEEDLPFAAQVAQLALQARTVEELERYMTSLYRLALDHGHPFLPDLADGLLRWAEQQRLQTQSPPRRWWPRR